MKLGFYGAAGEVTGSNHLLEGSGAKILVDCGMFQGMKVCNEKNTAPFPYDVSEIDALFVTHAHLDHVGRIPKLFKEGFKGKIYSTPPTKQIAELMFADTLHILGAEAQADNHEPMFGEQEIAQAMEHWVSLPYNQDIKIGELSIRFRDAGHILGSAMLEIEHNGKKIAYSGDLGNTPATLLRDTSLMQGINYLIMEATYGDRNHENLEGRTKLLKETIEETIRNKGVLMIPAFSIERTQDLLKELNDLIEDKELPEIPVFVDSPLAIKVTRVYEANQKYFNEAIQKEIQGGDNIFKFPRLRFTEHSRDSVAIKEVPGPKIVIAGSGMSNGGRILHHEYNYLANPKNTLLIIGYQAVGTMGRMLQEGAKSVTIFNEEVPVRAKIVQITSYSAHKDLNALVEFVDDMKETLKKVFVVHTEPGAGLFFAQRVRDYVGIDTQVPKAGEVFEIDF
jgi:metallo-beta-lactamase family protein